MTSILQALFIYFDLIIRVQGMTNELGISTISIREVSTIFTEKASNRHRETGKTTTMFEIQTVQLFTSEQEQPVFEIDDGNKLSTSPDINFDNTIPNGDEKTTVSNKISTSHYISDPCFEKGICNSDGISERGYCNCDVGCIEYNDCCSEALENVSYISKYHKYWNCYAHSNIREYFGGFFVVASCPNGYENGTVVSRCHEIDIIKNGPCVVYDNEIAFQNRFCALCHNITEFKFCKLKIYGPDVYSIFHRIGYSNKTKSEKLKVLLETDFDFLVDLPIESKSRFCMSSLIESTDVICRQSSINPVYQYRRGLPYFYKNIFCAPENIRESLLCVNDNFQRFVDPTKSLFPLTVMFSFSSEKENQDKDGCKLWTEANQEDETCSEAYVDPVIHLVPFELKVDVSLSDEDFLTVGCILAWSIEIISPIKMKVIKFQLNGNKSMIEDITQLRLLKTMFLHEVNMFVRFLNEMKWEAVFFDEMSNKTLELHKENIHDELSKTKLNAADQNVHVITLGDDKLIESVLFGKSVVLPKMSHLDNCNEISVQIVRNRTGQIHVEVISCKLGSNLNMDENEHLSLETIITYFALTVSTVALVFTILINRRYSFVSGIAGSNLENLSISMSLSNVAFMLGIGNEDNVTVCYVIGVLLHYLWLTVFSFMCIGNVCIVQNLTKLKSSMNKQQQETILKIKRRVLTVLGMVIPLIFVIPAVMSDKFGPDSFSPGYGDRVCFPNKFPGNLIFFSGPVMVSLVLCLLSLLVIVIKVTKLSIDIGQVSKSKAFTNAVIFLRILCLSNLFWVTGILASLFELDWLKYLFTTLCGLHGLFITIASLSTQQFRRKLRQKSVTENSNKKCEDISQFH